jgi:hypothetical protein
MFMSNHFLVMQILLDDPMGSTGLPSPQVRTEQGMPFPFTGSAGRDNQEHKRKKGDLTGQGLRHSVPTHL